MKSHIRGGIWLAVWGWGIFLWTTGLSGAEHCYTPPDYDYTISPGETWQTTGSVSAGTLGCRVYRMFLEANRGYDFSICGNDGVGSTCSPGDGDFEMYDDTGNLLWNIDGEPSCSGDATTLGTDKESWAPPADGYFYLRITEIRDKKLTYNLAYKCTLPLQSDIRIEPLSLTVNCTEESGGQAAQFLNTTAEENNSSETVENPDAKLINEADMEADFSAGLRLTRVIINLATPAEAQQEGIWKSPAGLKKLREKIKVNQQQVLTALTDADFQLRHLYVNQAGFSGKVTRSGLEKLKKHPLVVSIEPVYILHPHLQQGIGLMNAEPWRSSYNGVGMAIAVCDTGIDYTHPRLGNGGFPNSKVIGGYDFGDNDSNPIPNGNAHGTSCAGIAAGDLGTVGDYIGGVAYGARLYALKITSGTSGSATTGDMVAAWDWCVTHQNDDPGNPIMVISTSFGGNRFFDSCDNALSSMTQAANNAVAAGITVLASSGNDGWCESIAWPACISSVISVGAVYDAAFGTYYPCVDAASCVNKFATSQCTGWYVIDNTAADMVTSYSNAAPILDILAPSNQAYTTDIIGSAGYSSGDYYSAFGGTSAACPYAAGVVASLQSAAKNFTGTYLSPDEVKNLLINTGDNLFDPKANLTKPRVNLGHAIDQLAWTAPDENLVIYNDGTAPLQVTAITTPDWLTLSPEPPLFIYPGDNVSLGISVDCGACSGKQFLGSLEVFSNDPNENPYPNSPVITLICCVEPASFDNNCSVNLFDFTILSQNWQKTNCADPDWCAGIDMNQDGTVNLPDLMIWIEHWLYGT